MILTLKHIVKRDSKVEPFDINKPKRWSRWACKGLNRVDWPTILHRVLQSIHVTTISSDAFQDKLIDECLREDMWEYNIMAGRLYTAQLRKKLFKDGIIPKVRTLFNENNQRGLVREFNFTDAEWDKIEGIIDHSRDFDMAHFMIKQVTHKYSVKNRVDNEFFETPQFTYMRMACALSDSFPEETKMTHLANFYELFSEGVINCPSPNYLNLGTYNTGLASCCIFAADDSIDSLTASDVIAYEMTAKGCGTGNILMTRSLGDPIRQGAIVHQGKLPYYKHLGTGVKANIQSGRGGACNTYVSCYDPEIITIIMAQNPKTPEDKKNRMLNFTVILNRFIVEKALKNEDIFTFNNFTAPDLYKAIFGENIDEFIRLYEEYENNPHFKKNYINATQILSLIYQQAFEVSTMFEFYADEANRHTPFKCPIHTSNLCTEVNEPTKPYKHITDLYKVDHHDGEVAMCSLGGIVVYKIRDDEHYFKAAYYTLLMIDRTIHLMDYPFPHVEYTAKSRMNAGVGMLGNAYLLAKNGLSITTQEGKNFIHEIGERHAYFVTRASLQLGKELGNAPWMHKTKWPDGWLWIDTYNRNVDELVTVGYKYDWEQLRKEIIANGGIRNSTLINIPPTESSSKASGCPNGIYLLRELSLTKSDQDNTIDWCAIQPFDDVAIYEIAFDVPHADMIQMYAIYQKWVDQGISCDMYVNKIKNEEVTTHDVLLHFSNMVKYGMKSRYYWVSMTDIQQNACGSGGCTL